MYSTVKKAPVGTWLQVGDEPQELLPVYRYEPRLPAQWMHLISQRIERAALLLLPIGASTRYVAAWGKWDAKTMRGVCVPMQAAQVAAFSLRRIYIHLQVVVSALASSPRAESFQTNLRAHQSRIRTKDGDGHAEPTSATRPERAANSTIR